MAATKRKKSAKTDQELLRQIESAADSEHPIVGVFRLKPDDPAKSVNSPERTQELARKVLDRVRRRIGYGANRFNVLRNVGVVIVSAKSPFLDALRHEPEIVSAMANEHPGGSPMIQPLNKRSVPETPRRNQSRTEGKIRAHVASSGASGHRSSK